jgi:DNA-directed RNA polymerase specialized sigma24 family protein
LALRFVGHLDDAKDATQESLIRIVTRLGNFESRSKLTTWAYTVGLRRLLGTRQRLVESSVKGPRAFAAFLHSGMSDIDSTIDEAEYGPVRDGIPASCPYGVLLCLPRPQRAAHLFANVIGLSYVGGAVILERGRAAFRQGLSRTRRPP